MKDLLLKLIEIFGKKKIDCLIVDKGVAMFYGYPAPPQDLKTFSKKSKE